MALLLAVFLLTSLACGSTPAFLKTPDYGQGGSDPLTVQPADATATAISFQFYNATGAVTIIPGQTQAQATPTPVRTPRPPILYYAQSGDTLPALAARFGVSPQEITSPQAIPEKTLINPEQLLIIPDVLDEIGSTEPLLPDSEVVYSPSTVGFEIDTFIQNAGGYLSTYQEFLDTGYHSGAQVVERVASENSFNPRLLLALLEYQSGWVYGQPQNLAQTDYPLGRVELSRKGLYQQLTWAARQLTLGYYGWRSGSLVRLTFSDSSTQRVAPGLNAGSVALQYFFSVLYPSERWPGTLYGPDSLIALHARMFGDAWLRAREVDPLYPAFSEQPELELPFGEGQSWALTGGAHPAWGSESIFGALDFAPSSATSGCYESTDWVTAPAPGLVVRTGTGLVIMDLDGDGHEQTGWVLLFMHIASKDRVEVGDFLGRDDRLGHPSCEGGRATGTHVHIARKFNGEWIPIDGPLPFVLSGWTAYAGSAAYEGGMISQDGQEVKASVNADYRTLITRPTAP